MRENKYARNYTEVPLRENLYKLLQLQNIQQQKKKKRKRDRKKNHSNEYHEWFTKYLWNNKTMN